MFVHRKLAKKVGRCRSLRNPRIAPPCGDASLIAPLGNQESLIEEGHARKPKVQKSTALESVVRGNNREATRSAPSENGHAPSGDGTVVLAAPGSTAEVKNERWVREKPAPWGDDAGNGDGSSGDGGDGREGFYDGGASGGLLFDIRRSRVRAALLP